MPDNNPQSKTEVISVIKEYISPILITIIGMFIWRDMSELRTDVKTLLANQSANQVKIETLQEDVSALKTYVYSKDFIPYSNGRVSLAESQPAKKEDEIKIIKR